MAATASVPLASLSLLVRLSVFIYKGVEMKIEIQLYGWDLEIRKLPPGSLKPEEQIKHGPLTLGAVIIDGKVVGEITWDGEELKVWKGLLRRREDLNP